MAGDIETWESGFDKITKACVRYGAPLPMITSTQGMVNVRINPADSYMKVLEKTRKKAESLVIEDKNSAIESENSVIDNKNSAIGSIHPTNEKEKIE